MKKAKKKWTAKEILINVWYWDTRPDEIKQAIEKLYPDEQFSTTDKQENKE